MTLQASYIVYLFHLRQHSLCFPGATSLVRDQKPTFDLSEIVVSPIKSSFFRYSIMNADKQDVTEILTSKLPLSPLFDKSEKSGCFMFVCSADS